MKKFILFLTLIVFIGFISCDKILTETPGNIPGMGNNKEKPEVKEQYKLPDGIGIVGSIKGLEDADAKSIINYKPTYGAKSASYFGSGRLVRLTLTLVNSNNIPRTIFFPKGLVWECQVGGYQHGLQVQTTWICLQPNTTRSVIIDLYCCNLGLPGPTLSTTYKILGVTSSSVLWDFLNRIGWKKVNYEMINGTYGTAKGETLTGPTYDQITERFQALIHDLTSRGIGISEEDKLFIDSIPELAAEEIPQVDESSKYPDYFEEFYVSGN
jgi:hypothetical protein